MGSRRALALSMMLCACAQPVDAPVAPDIHDSATSGDGIAGTDADTTLDCDDGEPCTVDAHDASVGCSHEALADGANCGQQDVCQQGKCVARDMAKIPAGPFQIGCNAALVGAKACPYEIELPQHEVWLDAFLIDIYEVTVERYAGCVTAGVCSVPKATFDASKFFSWGNLGKEKHPITGISRAQAEAFCQWTHAKGRLPTEAEWEKAARGGCDKQEGDCAATTRTYPWGNEQPDCTLAVIQVPQTEDCFPHACGEGCQTLFTMAVGSKPKGASPYGLHDMAGNVSEFVVGCHLHDAYQDHAKTGAKNPVWDVCLGDPGDEVRGGSYNSPHKELRAGDRHAHPKGAVEDYVGFRCARDL